MLVSPAGFYGATIPAGLGVSTLFAEMDFEVYSEAGYYFDGKQYRRFNTNKIGLSIAGAWNYSLHPSTEILKLAYDLKDGQGPRLWSPGCPRPDDLFDFIFSGRKIEAWNSFFEYVIWLNVCEKRLGWPPLELSQMRDAMRKSMAHGWPAKLEIAAEVSGAAVQKDKAGAAIMKRVTSPRKPTIKLPVHRLTPLNSPEDFIGLGLYCIDDIRAEGAVSKITPDLSPFEMDVWQLDQRINLRGVHCNREFVNAAVRIIDQAKEKYALRLCEVTGGAVEKPTQVAALLTFIRSLGVVSPNLDKDALEDILARPNVHPVAREALEIRQAVSSASVKKTYAMFHQMGPDDRLRDLYSFLGAIRTWRWAGSDIQPQNLPGKGPKAHKCVRCGEHYGTHRENCPQCNTVGNPVVPWTHEVALSALRWILPGSLPMLEAAWGDALKVIAGCLRSGFTAGPGKEFISSDYAAIESVVISVLAGEEWRLEVFRTHGKIYEATASKISGIPLAEILAHKERTGEHHPLRGTVGKVGELASGFGGGWRSWEAFGADEFMTRPEMEAAVKTWRKANPQIVKLWYGLEHAAKEAIQHPGRCYWYRGIGYGVRDNVLYCRLPSGRSIPYHNPRLLPDETPWGKPTLRIEIDGWDSYSKSWCTLDTWGGKLAENATQAIARDILAAAMLRVDAAGYPIVMHTHDELVAEVPIGFGSIEEVERLMGDVDAWARGWPIKAAGGWRGHAYRKG